MNAIETSHLKKKNLKIWHILVFSNETNVQILIPPTIELSKKK